MFSINIPFKGNRPYLRGADIYTALVEFAKNQDPLFQGPVTINFRHLPKTACAFTLNNKDMTPPTEVYADFSLGKELGSKKTGWLVPIDGAAPHRIAFDEDALIKDAIINDKIIELITPSSGLFIDQVVALTKKLHMIHRPIAPSSWILTRIEFEEILFDEPILSIMIKLVQILGSRLTRSEVFYGGKLIGNLYFSGVVIGAS